MQTVWTEIRLDQDKTAPYEALRTWSILFAFQGADGKTDWFSVLHLSKSQLYLCFREGSLKVEYEVIMSDSDQSVQQFGVATQSLPHTPLWVITVTA